MQSEIEELIEKLRPFMYEADKWVTAGAGIFMAEWILTLHRSNVELTKRVEVLEKKKFTLRLKSNSFDVEEMDL